MKGLIKKTSLSLKLVLILLCLVGCTASADTPPVNQNDLQLIESEEKSSVSVTASVSPAIYNTGEEPSEVSFEYDSQDGSVVLRYTTNYSEPDADSTEYDGEPIEIKYSDTKDGYTKQATIRCALFKDGERISEIENFVYMSAPEGRFEFPVYNIYSNKRNFYSNDTGILVPGKLAAEGNPEGWQPWYSNANYYGRGIEWERPIGLTIFNSNGTLAFNTNCGVRVSGGYTRVNKQKSLRLYARKTYTPDSGVFEYSFWDGLRGSQTDTPVSFSDTVLLRGGSNNESNAIYTTPSLLMLLDGTDLDRPAISPVIEYINGIYYGVVMQLEDYDPDYFLQHYGIEEEDLSTIKGTAPELMRTTGWYLDDGPEGEEDELINALSFISKNKMNDPENYKKATEMIDIQNFIEYMAFEAYLGNSDWPDNNLRAWRYNKNGYDPDAEGVYDGRWRFLTKDLDLSFGYGSFDVNSNPYAAIKGSSTLLLKNAYTSLMKNEEFADLFYSFMCTLADSVVSPERCEHMFDLMQVYMGRETAISIESCGVASGSRSTWNWGFDVLRDYSMNRASVVQKFTKSESGKAYGEVTVSYEGEGEVRIGWFDTENGETRSYLKETRIPLEITPADGYEISDIVYENCEMTDDGYLVLNGSNASVKVVFAETNKAEQGSIVINEVMFRHTDYKWVELYNTTDEAITLRGWSLGKKKKLSKAVPFDNVTIEAHSYALICATDYSNSQGIEGLSVALSFGNDDTLYLFDGSGNIVDSVELSSPSKTVHIGRLPDGGELTEFSKDEATPGSANAILEDKSYFGSDSFKPYVLILGKVYEFGDIAYEKDGEYYVNSDKLISIVSTNTDCKDIYRYLVKKKKDVTVAEFVEANQHNEGAGVRYIEELDSYIIG